MFSKTRFGQLINGLPRPIFDQLTDQYQSDKYNKGFTSWSHLVTMIYGQLSSSRSLRELETRYNAHADCHYHLGTKTLKRSTLSDANQQRDARLFGSLCTQMLKTAHRHVRHDANELLYLLDSSPICLRGRGYEWTKDTMTRNIPGLKLHVLYCPKAQLPCQVKVGPANENDVLYGREIRGERGATYVFDKGYCDYNWWHRLDQSNSYFVTRFKKNAGVQVMMDRPIPRAHMCIVSDQVVRFKTRRAGGKRINAYYGKSLRRIVVDRPDKDTPMTIATNDMDRPAIEIAQLYKQRWDIELWFKWIKQRLRIKQFLGRSENAVKIQIYTALICYLLLYRYRKMSGTPQPFYLWVAELKATLFQRTTKNYMDRKRRAWSARQNLSLQTEIPI